MIEQGNSIDPAPQLSLDKIRYGFYHIYLAFSLGLNTVLLIPQSRTGEVSENSNFVASWAIIQMIAVAFLLLYRRHNRQYLPAMLVASAFIVASITWSPAPSSTATYGLMLIGNAFVAYMMACELSTREIIKLATRVIMTLVVASLVGYIVKYNQVLYYDDHNRPTILGTQPLRGFFPHKILASLYSIFGIVGCLATMKGIRRLASVALGVIFVVLTGAATGETLLPVALIVFALAWVSSRGRLSAPALFTLIGSMFGAAATAVWLLRDQVLAFLGRDLTLTGRTLLWRWGWHAWSERPIFGWATKAYFETDDSLSVQATIPEFREWTVPHFHQSYIQTAVDLGLIGLLVAVYVLIATMVRSYRMTSETREPVGIAAFSIVATMAVGGFAIFLFFNYNNFATILLISLFVSTGIWRKAKPYPSVTVSVRPPRARIDSSRFVP